MDIDQIEELDKAERQMLKDSMRVAELRDGDLLKETLDQCCYMEKYANLHEMEAKDAHREASNTLFHRRRLIDFLENRVKAREAAE